MVRSRSGTSREGGSVAITVALSLVTLIAIAGAAVDLMRFVYAKNAMQSAMDGAMVAASAAALSEATGATPDSAKMRQIAIDYFNTNSLPDGALVQRIPPGFNPQYDAASDSVTSTLDFDVPMTFMRIMGFNTLTVHLASTAKRPVPAPVQMVLVVDSTESMGDAFGSSTKMAALKTSAKTLITLLMKSPFAKLGVLPFGWLVRLDTSQGGYATSVLDPQTNTSIDVTSNVGWLTFPPAPVIYDCTKWQVDQSTCKTVNGTCYKDGVPYTCQSNQCTSKCLSSVRRAVTWAGCVFLRSPPNRNVIADPINYKYYGVLSAIACVYAPIITDLVTKGQAYGTKTAEQYLTDKIDAMAPMSPGIGSTYIPGALIWAWNMMTVNTKTNGAIDTDYPLNSGYTDAEVQQRGVRRALVLITDGANTSYAVPVTGTTAYQSLGLIANTDATKQAANQQAASDDMKTVCQNIKDSGIAIYIIALQLSASDRAYQSLLQDNCATKEPGISNLNQYFFNIADPTQLQQAFDRIGKSLTYNSLTQ